MPTPDTLARELADLRRRLESTERASQMKRRSLEGGALAVYDEDGTLRGRVGLLPDGTTGMVALSGPVPPIPSAPTLTPVVGGLEVRWDGGFQAGAPRPGDFHRVEVHASPLPGFTPSAATLRAALVAAGAHVVALAAGVRHYVALVTRSTSDVASPPSAVTEGTPGTVEDAPDDVPPSTPAAPEVAGSPLRLQVRHDLTAVNGDALEEDLDHLEVHLGPDQAFNATQATLAGKIAANRSHLIAGVGVVGSLDVTDASPRWVRVRAVDRSGNVSGQSPAVTATAELVDSAYIADAAITSAKIGEAQIGSAHVAELDAGKITSGTIDAARIAAQSITVDQLVVGDVTNLVRGGDFETGDLASLLEYVFAGNGPVVPWSIATSPDGVANVKSGARSLMVKYAGGSIPHAVARFNRVPCRPGDTFYATAWAGWRGANPGAMPTLVLAWRDASGALLGNSPSGFAGKETAHAGAGLTTELVCPAQRAPAGAAFVSAEVRVYNGAALSGDCEFYFDNVSLHRAIPGAALTADTAIINDLNVEANLVLSGNAGTFQSSTSSKRVAIEADDVLYLYDGGPTSRWRMDAYTKTGLSLGHSWTDETATFFIPAEQNGPMLFDVPKVQVRGHHNSTTVHDAPSLYVQGRSNNTVSTPAPAMSVHQEGGIRVANFHWRTNWLLGVEVVSGNANLTSLTMGNGWNRIIAYGDRTRFNFTDGSNTVYAPIYCADVVESSSRTRKREIVPLALKGREDDPHGALHAVRDTPVYRYRMQADARRVSETGEDDEAAEPAPEMIGVMAEEVPADLVGGEPGTVSWKSALWTLWKAVQELSEEVDALRTPRPSPR